MLFISCSSINPCLMFRSMLHKSAGDDYKPILTTDWCMIKREGVVDGEGGSSERCLKWGGGG